MNRISIIFKSLIGLNSLLCLVLLGACSSSRPSQRDKVYEIKLEDINVFSSSIYKGSALKRMAIRHMELQIRPDWAKRQIEGTALLTIEPYALPQDTIDLDARGFSIHELQITDAFDKSLNNSYPYNLQYRYNNRKLHVLLGRTFKPGEWLTISIKYTARPEGQYSLGLISKKTEQGLYFINPDGRDSTVPRELWSQGETHHNSAWFPTIDEVNQKFTQDIYITVEKQLTTLSNGTLLYSSKNADGTRTDVWQMEKPHSPYLTMIAVGNWTVVRDEWRDSIPVEYYVEPKYAKDARIIFGPTIEMMEFYSRLLNYDYPWPKFAQLVAREFVSGAMENTTAVVHYEPVQHDRRTNIDNDNEILICHELFHHWFGDLVTCESWANLALNESMATLGEYLWLEHKHGYSAAEYQQQSDLDAYLSEAEFSQEPIINYYYNDPEQLFDRHRYEKGGLVIHMLRSYLGDSLFLRGLHQYLVKNAFGNTELADFRMAFEEVSGEDLNWFFCEWFEKPGHPVLEIRQQPDPNGKKVKLIVQQTQAKGQVPVFKYPIYLDAWYQGSNHPLRKIVWLRHAKDSFDLDADKLLLINFDAKKDLLCRKSEVKPLRQWYSQFLLTSGYRNKYEALTALSRAEKLLQDDSLKSIIVAGLADEFWNIRKLTLDKMLYNAPAEIRGAFSAQVRALAIKDINSRVRVAALQYLAATDAVNSKDIFRRCLTDSSYLVTAEAIKSLRQATPKELGTDLIKQLSGLENLNSREILLALTDLYSLYPDPSKAAFFRYVPAQILPNQMSSYLEDYKLFLFGLSDQDISQNSTFILSLDEKAKDYWSRSIYKSLLTELAGRLAKEKTAADSLSEEKRSELIKKFSFKADNLDLENDRK